MTNPIILTPTQAGEYLNVASNTLRSWRVSGIGPAFIRLSPRMIGYKVADLDDWVEANRVGGGATPTGRLHAHSGDPEAKPEASGIK